MGKDNRYDFDSGSSDSIGEDPSESDGGATQTGETVAKEAEEGKDRTGGAKTAVESGPETGTKPETGEVENATPTDDSLPRGGEAGTLRTDATNHTLPEEFSMSNLPVKQRRSNVKEYRDVDLTITIQQETLDDVQDAKRMLENHFDEGVPKTDVYEIVMIAGANDDLSLLDAAHIVGYGID
jgi:hypothetical protein